MRAFILAVCAAAAVTACSAATNGANVADFKVGDCLKLGGTPARPEATRAACGSPASNFKVVAAVADRTQCPTDIDSSYSMHNSISGSNNTVCLDIDWVIGGCMSVDPRHTADPIRVDCNDVSAPHRQRATQILQDLDPPVTVYQCASGLGYTYAQRRFAVCVEDMGSAGAGAPS